MYSLTDRPIAAAVGVIFALLVVRFFVNGYRHRKLFRSLPGPPHSWLWGHLRVLGEVKDSLPPRVHPHVLPHHLQREHDLGSYFYLDTWPITDSMLAVIDPELAQDVTVKHSIPKHPSLAELMVHIAGEGDLVSSEGAHWKTWRSILNPGFAASHLMTLAAGIVDDSLVFVEILEEHAQKQDVFRLEEAATRLTVDIIGKVVLDLSFNAQRSENELVNTMRDQVRWCRYAGYSSLLSQLDFYAAFKRWQNSRKMRASLGKVLEERFAGHSIYADGQSAKGGPKKRTIIDLALESYSPEQQQVVDGDKGSRPLSMDANFKSNAITQILTFIFAGHDTTSSTICYAYHLLSEHPECLSRIRNEHDDVLGSVDGTADAIKANPHIVNQLEYTLCVIKEVLRLYPAASSVRTGESGYTIRDPVTGVPLPSEGYLVWVNSYSTHRNPLVWSEPAKFDPSRFLPENAATLPPNAWRPFEKGIRNCIGQDLAMLETKIILALTLRTFDFKVAYDCLDALKDDGSAWSKDDSWRTGKQDLDGVEAYQVLVGTAKPREGMPIRVRKRDTTAA